MIIEDLDINGVTNDGRFVRTRLSITNGAGTWQPWTELKVAGDASYEPLNSIDSAGDPLRTHLCATTVDGRLLYTSRALDDATWEPLQDVGTMTGGEWKTFQQVSVERIVEDLHLCVLVHAPDSSQRILHTVRHFDGTWEKFEEITQDNLAGFPGSCIAVDCASGTASEQLLHVCAITEDGRLWHTTFSHQHQWSKFEDVKAASSNDPGALTDVRLASLNDKLHVCAAAAGDLWHTILFAAPTHWQAAFDNVKQEAGDPGSVFSFDCASGGEKLHLCVVTEDGKLWQTAFFENPDGWVSFDDVTAILGDSNVFLQFISTISLILSTIIFFGCPSSVEQRIANNCYRIRRGDRNSNALRANNQSLHAQNPLCSLLC